MSTQVSAAISASRVIRLRRWTEEFIYVDRYELADGTIVTKDVFAGQAEFDGQFLDIDVILTDSADTLIGGSMMRHPRIVGNSAD